MSTGFLNIPWFVWALLALVVATVFVFIVPNADRVHATQGFQFIIVRWFHSLVWVLLAVSFFLRGLGNETLANLANPIALAGGITYAIYMLTFVSLSSK